MSRIETKGTPVVVCHRDNSMQIIHAMEKAGLPAPRLLNGVGDPATFTGIYQKRKDEAPLWVICFAGLSQLNDASLEIRDLMFRTRSETPPLRIIWVSKDLPSAQDKRDAEEMLLRNVLVEYILLEATFTEWHQARLRLFPDGLPAPKPS